MGRVTLRSLAAELGMAPCTVLRALTDHPNVSLDTRRRAIGLARQRGYSLPQHSRRVVAVIIPGFQFEGYMGFMLSSVMQELSRNGLHGEIISVSDLEILREHLYDGAISIVWNQGLERLWPKEYVLPLVVVNAAANPRQGIYQVSSDERQGITLGMEHLHRKGRRNFALFSPDWDDNLNARSRIEAFSDFRNHARINAAIVRRISCDFEQGRLIHLLRDNRIDAILLTCETFAPQMVFHLHSHGVRIPDDIAFLAMENPVNPFIDPPVSALSQDFDGLARQSVRLLLRRINRKDCRRSTLVPYKLIERSST